MAQLLFFFPPLQVLREKCTLRLSFQCRESKKQKSQEEYRKTSACAIRLTLKEKDIHCNAQNISSLPGLCVLP